MSETATVLIERVETKGDWYELYDGNGTKYSTKKASIVEPARRMIGERAVLTFITKQNGNFTNYYLDKVEEAPRENGDHPPLGTGEYVKGQMAPTDARRILACSAWNCAATMAQSELGFEAAKHIADKVFVDLLRKSHLMTDDDIPF